ncbi:MAG TPA: hypothetical protein VNT54_01705, partial [Solirubrobacteraceae bacterium]|nr:hypothetical protein [Solirubrobacteraceae bacterium]
MTVCTALCHVSLPRIDARLWSREHERGREGCAGRRGFSAWMQLEQHSGDLDIVAGLEALGLQ